jgi:uncharacterized protein
MMTFKDKAKIKNLESLIIALCKRNKRRLLFHGWHHIDFVRRSAIRFGRSIKANLFLVETAALVHDLNYLVKTNSDVAQGSKFRNRTLRKCGYNDAEIGQIEKIVREAETGKRGKFISPEGKALSDGDSLFKVLPITPVLFTSRYIQENKVDIHKLSRKIVEEQVRLLEQGIFFYTKEASEYLPWAKNQFRLWQDVRIALKDKEISRLLKNAKKYSIL